MERRTKNLKLRTRSVNHKARTSSTLYALRSRSTGFTLIDVLISVAIIVMLFGGIYLIYFSIIDVINNIELRAAATSVVESEMEIARNLDYGDVGTVNGIPPGIIPQNKLIAFENFDFSVTTTIRNIDDPFDGTLGGVPNDTAPADYKLIEMEIGCPSCAKFAPLIYTATVAPDSLEGASNDGSLFVNVFNANGEPVSGAQVHVVNNSVVPTIDLIDATNNLGVLQLVGVPTSTQSYEIEVSFPGYSTERTYSSTDLGGSIPSKPHSTVAAQTVTSISFAIDAVSDLNLMTKDYLCSPIGGVDFSVTGAKLIGTVPDFYKFSTSSITDSNSFKSFSDIEWDTYSFAMNSSSLDVLGSIPLSPVIINPSSTANYNYILQSADPSSFLVAIKDITTGDPVSGASVNLSRPGFSETKIAGRALVSHSDWSSGSYNSKDGIEVDSMPGSMELMVNVSGTYNVSEVGSLISNTIDVGGSSSTFLYFKLASDLAGAGSRVGWC